MIKKGIVAAGAIGALAYGVLKLPQFGRKPANGRLKRINSSPNFKEGKFRNLIETPMMAADTSYVKLIRQQLNGKENRSPGVVLPYVKRDLRQPVDPEQLLITWFGHSSALLQLEGKNILIDPVFSKRASPFQFAGAKSFPGSGTYEAEDLPDIDCMLISHDHYDHLDYNTLVQLAPRTATFYVPLGVGAHLESWGVSPEKIYELDWWDEIPLADNVLLAATPSRHFSGRGVADRDKTLWTSFVIRSRKHNVYLGSDSGYGHHFKAIGEKYGPFDICMLECGQYHDYWPNVHMMPEESFQAFLDLKGKLLMPIHWAKFSLSLHSWTEPVERLLAKAAGSGVDVLTPVPGERVQLKDGYTGERWWKSLANK